MLFARVSLPLVALVEKTMARLESYVQFSCPEGWQMQLQCMISRGVPRVLHWNAVVEEGDDTRCCALLPMVLVIGTMVDLYRQCYLIQFPGLAERLRDPPLPIIIRILWWRRLERVMSWAFTGNHATRPLL